MSLRNSRSLRASPAIFRVSQFSTHFSSGIDEELYRKFEEKSLDEQADEITRDLVYGERNLLFDFDHQDKL